MDERVNLYHILPVNDTKEHDESMACSCRPEIRKEEGIYIIIHNAFDGREWSEWAKRKI